MLKVNPDGYLVASVRDVYNEYKKHPNRKQEVLDYRTFRDVLEFIFTRIWFYMITELWVFKPPHKFGEFYVAEVMSSDGFYKDWKLTNKKGSLVKNYNLHTNGIKFFTKWNKRLARITNQQGYRFVSYRGKSGEPLGKRGLCWWIKKSSEDYKMKDYRAHIF